MVNKKFLSFCGIFFIKEEEEFNFSLVDGVGVIVWIVDSNFNIDLMCGCFENWYRIYVGLCLGLDIDK